MGSLGNTKSSRLSSEIKELSPRRVLDRGVDQQGNCLLCGFPNIEFKRRHCPEMLSKTNWLIEQQIARYFSRLSVLNERWFIQEVPEADANDLACKMQTKTAGAAVRLQKIQTFASHFSFKFNFVSHENNWLCLGIFSLREICRKSAGSFFN